MKKLLFALTLGVASVSFLSSCNSGDDEVVGSQLTGQYLKATVDSSENATGQTYLFTNALPTGKFTNSGSLSTIILTTPNTSFPLLSLTLNVSSLGTTLEQVAKMTLPKAFSLDATSGNVIVFSKASDKNWSSLLPNVAADNITITKVEVGISGSYYFEGTFNAHVGNPSHAITNGSFRAAIIK